MTDGRERTGPDFPVVSRRNFLRQASVGAAAVVLVGAGVPGVVKGPAYPTLAQASGVVMPDPSLCIGCLTCEVECVDVHRAAGLSDVPRIRIYDLESVEVDPKIIESYGDRGRFIQQPCVQCPDAPCLGVCPVDALRVEPRTGARYIDEGACIACSKCAEACVFPNLDDSLSTGSDRPLQTSRITYDPVREIYAKCDLCFFREEGPACIQRCPVNVRIKQGLIESDVLCLDLPPATRANFDKILEQEQALVSAAESMEQT
jgi:Fe-S-cluster-containing hydrogenase component 2